MDDECNGDIFRKDTIAELIAKTKLMRHEKQSSRDEQDDITERLDDQLRRMMTSTGAGAGAGAGASVFSMMTGKDRQVDNSMNNSVVDSYDKYVSSC
jgi:hypothetical protein